VDGYFHGLSITKRNTVLINLISVDKIYEYSLDWRLKRVIHNPSLPWPRHSVQLTRVQFVVSHGLTGMETRICLINLSSKQVTKCYGGQSGSGVGQMKSPVHIAVDEYSNVLVADMDNHRIELLSPTLTHLGYLSMPGINSPTTLYLDDINHRLYVGDNIGQVFLFIA